MKNILTAIASLWRRNKQEDKHLYYLDNIKPIQVNKYVLEECTVGRD